MDRAGDSVAGTEGGSAPRWFPVVLVAVVCAAGLSLPVDTLLPLGFVPVAGVLMAGLFVLNRGQWILAATLAVALEAAVHGALRGAPRLSALVAMALAPLAAGAAVALLGSRDAALVPSGNLARFGVGVLVGTGVAGIAGLAGGASPGRQVVDAVSVGVGMVVVAPVVLSWRRPPPASRSPAEVAAIAALVVAVPAIVFLGPGLPVEATFPYLAIPAMTWAALRLGLTGGSVASLLVASFALWGVALGVGPFVAAEGPRIEAVLVAQLFVVVATLACLFLAAAVEDLRDRRVVERHLRHEATHDPLTGLPNRLLLSSVLGDALAEPGDHEVAVLMCDIDFFKVVNDGLGHRAGDDLLVQVAERLRACLRPQDLLARLSGDEFVVVVPNAPPGALEVLSERILRVVSSPLSLDGCGEIRPSLSIGGASAHPGASPGDLLREADAALYRAKDEGRGRMCRFDEDLREEVHSRLLIQTDFEPALASGEVHWLHQPEIDLHDGSLFSIEALCRWDHPRVGPIRPDRFVPVVEFTGHAGLLFRHALDAALRTQEDVLAATGFRPSIAVNISASLLADRGLAEEVGATLDAARPPVGTIWFEVTESVLATPGAPRTLAALQELGVLFAIDDFGTGWSSMSRLTAFGWDALKVDRSFVAALDQPDNAHVAHVVAAVVAMAHSLHVRVVAEGVETPNQLRQVRELGCDVAQGWLFSPAVPGERLAGLLDADGMWRGPGADLLVPSPRIR